MSEPVRVRIAPSPTGEPHIGTAYIALFDYCLAKNTKGSFVLRIEDTDQSRCTKQSEESIFDCLRWLGLDWDEGPDKGGPYGPYRQSERLDIYKKYALELIEKGAAYYCFCTPARLTELRAQQMAAKASLLGYDGHCRGMDPAEAKRRVAAGEAHVIRLKVPKEEGATTAFFDEIRKKDVEYKNSEIDDQVLLKADGFPTYHLANVVDDHLMKINLVTRAEEWIPSTPKHVLLYRAFGWQAPKFAHFSLLRNADKSKVSKRKNPVSLRWFRAAGYTKEALINFLALMGYSSGKEGERITLDELASGFSLDRISTTSPIFDLAKLNNLNEEYIRKLSPEGYIQYLKETAGHAAAYLAPVIAHVQDRHKIGQGFNVWTDMFFKVELEYSLDALVTKGIDKKQAETMLAKAAQAMEKMEPFNNETIDDILKKTAEGLALEHRPALMAVRVGITGSQTSLPLYESMQVLGRDRCVIRLKQAASYLKTCR